MKIVGYLSENTIYHILGGSVANIKFEQLTHLIYSYAKITSASDPTLTSGFGPFAYLSACVSAAHAKGVKVFVSLEEDTMILGPIIDSDILRATLVSNAVTLLATYGADGIDLDWEEYPLTTLHRDRQSLLILDLYAVLNPLGKKISIYGFHDPSTYSAIQDITLATESYIDFISLSRYQDAFEVSVAQIDAWVAAGFTKGKLCMGMPFFGWDSGKGIGTWGQIIDEINPAHEINQASVATIGGISVTGGILYWHGIDDALQMVDYVKANGFGGVMCFDIGQDKLNDSRSLLQNIYNELNPPHFTLDLLMVGQGTITPPPGQYDYVQGDSVPLSAVPAAGWMFVGWEENEQPLSTELQFTIQVNSDRVITAVFEKIILPPNQYAVTISVIGEGTTLPAPGAYTYNQGETANIEAKASAGWQFNHWEGDVTGTQPTITFTLESNMSVTAVFVEKAGPGFIELLWGFLPFFPWEGPPLPRFSGFDWNHLRTPGGVA